MKSVLVHMADGFEEVEALAVVDVLRRAGTNALMVSIMGRKQVEGGHGIVVQADTLFEEADYEKADMIFLPGGGNGTKNLKKHVGLREKIKQFHQKKKWIAAICAAPTVLGSLGLLEGKTAVCYPGCENELIGAKISASPVEVDGNIITSKGVGTALELALKLVELLEGKEKAESLRKSLVIP